MYRLFFDNNFTKLLLVITCTFSFEGSKAQADEDPFTTYKLTRQILNNLENTDELSSGYQKAAYELSFIGAYKELLKTWDLYSDVKAESLGKEDSIIFLKFKPVNAVETLIKKYGNEKAIFINEAHHIPLHRRFVLDLLEGLYNNGFRYFGAESLNHDDTLLNSRGYPVLNSGFYTNEPVYGQLIREAINIGYTVFPYERKAYAEMDSAGNVTWFGMEKDREQEQAKNVAEIFSHDPDAKVLILAGFAHIYENKETRIAGNQAMAVHFKGITGIDPITIDQVEMTEKSDQAFENPYYRMREMEKSSLFIDDEENIFKEPKMSNKVDIQIFHPRTKYINNRPDWLLFSDKKFFKIDKTEIDLIPPFLIKAFDKNEGVEAVPVDVVEVTNNDQEIYLVLPPGDYFLNIINYKEDQNKLPITVPF